MCNKNDSVITFIIIANKIRRERKWCGSISVHTQCLHLTIQIQSFLGKCLKKKLIYDCSSGYLRLFIENFSGYTKNNELLLIFNVQMT